jgi:hypothetical protein
MPEEWPAEVKHDVEAIMKGGHVSFLSARPAPFASAPLDFNSSQAPKTADNAKPVLNSHLARGLALWRAGDQTGAQKEFEALAAENPDSPIAAGLVEDSKVLHMAELPGKGNRG